MAPELGRGPSIKKAQHELGFYVNTERWALRMKEERRLWDITAARWPDELRNETRVKTVEHLTALVTTGAAARRGGPSDYTSYF